MRLLRLSGAVLLVVALSALLVGVVTDAASAATPATAWTVSSLRLPTDAVRPRAARVFDEDCRSEICVTVGRYSATSQDQPVGYLERSSPGVTTSVQVPLPKDAAAQTSEATATAVSCAASYTCVAVGGYGRSGGGEGPLIETFLHGSWRAQSLPVDGVLTNVSCGHICVAVGVTTDQAPLVADNASGSWRVRSVSLPVDASPPSLSSVSCPPSGGCAIIGANSTGPLYFLRGSGGWLGRYIDLPTDAQVGPVSCPAPATCDALVQEPGQQSNNPDVVAFELTAGTATVSPIIDYPPDTGGYGLNLGGIDCRTVSFCASVATSYLPDAEYGLLYTRSGDAWTATTAPLPANATPDAGSPTLSDVACRAVGKCTAVGNYLTTVVTGNGAPTRVYRPLLDILGSGSWRAAGLALPAGVSAHISDGFTSVACGSRLCAAGGVYFNSGTFYPYGGIQAIKP